MRRLLAANESIDVPPHSGTVAEALARLRARGSDVVVTGEQPETDEVDALLSRQPRLKVLTIREGGKAATLLRLMRVRCLVEDLSAEGLLGAIRGEPSPNAIWEIDAR